ncbi:MotA/TolQ/ExbB proton channel family protein [Candidatus Poribacteria bacterium]|nr:MotA/TolQ/ExbB proton channel family protein [Candidatus Poribacteria bacterium]
MRELFIKGGIFMWPLLLCSIIGVGIIIERLITFIRSKTNADEFMVKIIDTLESNPDSDDKKARIQKAIGICAANANPVSSVIQAGLEKAGKSMRSIERAMEKASVYQISLLERGLAVLATVATISPLLGFLGTVSGMIRSFSVIAASATRDPQGVARGISEALITTAAGLVIAIPIFIAYNFFVNWIGRFTLQMEESAGTLLDSLIEIDAVADVHISSED